MGPAGFVRELEVCARTRGQRNGRTIDAMSVPVALDELERRVDELGPHPFLVTTSADGRAHVVSVAVQFDGARFSMPAGRTSRANATANETVTMLWPGAGGGPYGLIVDGRAGVDAEAELLTVTPTRAVLHRLAGASDELPSCVRIEAT
jgi:hypothetical protein